MSIKVNSLSGKEWLEAMKSSRSFLDRFSFEGSAMIHLVGYIEEECGGWEKYIRRFQGYGKSRDYVRELWHSRGLGRDKIYNFVYNLEGSFTRWLEYDYGDDNILKVLKHYNCNIMCIKYNWLKKDDDMFIHLCCDFVGDLTYKLLSFVAICEL